MQRRAGFEVSGGSSGPSASGNDVTVVIPCWNYGRFLPEAIESALGQTSPPARVVVVDDGSSDDTPEVAASYGEALHYVRSRHVGQTRIRNLGLTQVDTRYVIFLDADDRLAPTYIERCLLALETADPPGDFVYTQALHFGDVEEGLAPISQYPSWSLEQIKVGNFVNASALLPVAILGKRPYDRRIRRGYGDWDLYLFLAGHGRRGILVDEPLLEYRRHGTSLQRRFFDSPGTERRLRAYLTLKHWRLYGIRHALWASSRHLARWALLRLGAASRRVGG